MAENVMQIKIMAIICRNNHVWRKNEKLLFSAQRNNGISDGVIGITSRISVAAAARTRSYARSFLYHARASRCAASGNVKKQ